MRRRTHITQRASERKKNSTHANIQRERELSVTAHFWQTPGRALRRMIHTLELFLILYQVSHRNTPAFCRKHHANGLESPNMLIYRTRILFALCRPGG